MLRADTSRRPVSLEVSRATVSGARVLVVQPSDDPLDALVLAPILGGMLDAGAASVVAMVTAEGRRELGCIDISVQRKRFDPEARPSTGRFDHVVDLSGPEPKAPAANRAHVIDQLRARSTPALPPPRWPVPLRLTEAQRTKALGSWSEAPRRLLIWLGPWSARHRGAVLRAGLDVLDADDGARVVIASGDAQAPGPAEAQHLAARALAVALGSRAKAVRARSPATRAALVDAADLIVAEDGTSALMAVMAGRPTLGLYVQRDPVSWGPYTPAKHQRAVKIDGRLGDDPALCRLVGRDARAAWRLACAR